MAGASKRLPFLFTITSNIHNYLQSHLTSVLLDTLDNLMMSMLGNQEGLCL